MENKIIMPSQGHIRQLWAESFDVEMDRFLLMPANNLECCECPNRSKVNQAIEQTFLSKAELWLIGKIEDLCLKSRSKFASRIMDRCFIRRDALTESGRGR